MAAFIFPTVCLVLMSPFVFAEDNHHHQRQLSSYVDFQLRSLQFEIDDMKKKFDQHETTIAQQTTKLREQEAKIQKRRLLMNQLSDMLSNDTIGTGTVYTRWGKTNCTNNASLVYSEDGQRRQLSDVQSQLQSMQFEIQNIKTNYSRHETLISSRTTKLRNLEAKLEYQVPLINRATNQIPKMSKGSGTVYIRWGKESCSQNSTKVYSGYAAGSGYRETGSSGKTLCLSPDPLWSFPEPATSSYEVSHIFGSEYEFDLFSQYISDEDIPCTVCMSQHGSEVLMISGRNRCYGDWSEEYRGFLLGPISSQHSLDYICIDEYPETLPGGSTNENGRLFYLVETECSSLKCPPYEKQKIVTCVVCSK